MHVDSHQIILETTWGWGLGYARRGRLWGLILEGGREGVAR